jgi:hypothetical protein
MIVMKIMYKIIQSTKEKIKVIFQKLKGLKRLNQLFIIIKVIIIQSLKVKIRKIVLATIFRVPWIKNY